MLQQLRKPTEVVPVMMVNKLEYLYRKWKDEKKMMMKLNEIAFDILRVEILEDFHWHQIIFSEYLVLPMDLIKALGLVQCVVLKLVEMLLLLNFHRVMEVMAVVVEAEVEVDMRNKVYFDSHSK
jgi:hypothetical protein